MIKGCFFCSLVLSGVKESNRELTMVFFKTVRWNDLSQEKIVSTRILAPNLSKSFNLMVQSKPSFYGKTILTLKLRSEHDRLRLFLRNLEGFKSRVQELNLPRANYEFAA